MGALASGVNRPTAVALCAACAALLLPQAALLYVALQRGAAVGHCCLLIALTLALLAAVGWCGSPCHNAVLDDAASHAPLTPPRFLSQVGLVSTQAQRAELGLTGAPEEKEKEKEKDA